MGTKGLGIFTCVYVCVPQATVQRFTAKNQAILRAARGHVTVQKVRTPLEGTAERPQGAN